MTTELRAPDPTLTAHLAKGDERPVTPYVQRTILTQPGRLPVAHRVVGHEDVVARWNDVDYVAACRVRARRTVPTDNARWFAIPCRDCWPDAPPPGANPRRVDDTCAPDCPGHPTGEDEHLAWQTR